MRRTEALQGVRMIKFRSVFERYEASELNQIEAAELLGISERTFRRWCRALRGQRRSRPIGPSSGPGLGQAGAGGAATGDRDLVSDQRYSGFTARHFHEHLVREHTLQLGLHLDEGVPAIEGAAATRAKTRAAHRRKRPRRPLPGMMLHQDGSRHEWIAGLDAMDLIVTMDDATNTIYSGFLVAEEGIASTFQALLEVFGRHGLPLSLYTDRGSHHFYTPEAGGPVTQVGRAPRVVSSTRLTWISQTLLASVR